MAGALTRDDAADLARRIKVWGGELGFQQVGIADTDLAKDERYLLRWLEQDMHGEMGYMKRHASKRSRPQELVPGTIRIISVRMDYMPEASESPQQVLDDKEKAYVSRYAMGRDYHKLMRKRLQRLSERISEEVGEHSYRVFSDSAPVLEKAIARNAGLGWIGKHSNLIHPKTGSWFFLGELYTDLPLPVDQSFDTDHCGSCTACIDACPTQAIVAPYKVDARRCISYLTIELRQSIPVEFREDMGNRIYGCDDCQLACPWNKFTHYTAEDDFSVRNNLDSSTLLALFGWSEVEFLSKTEGSAIRRIGYELWLRNIAVALGNLAASTGEGSEVNRSQIIRLLEEKVCHPSAVVREHVEWALLQYA